MGTCRRKLDRSVDVLIAFRTNPHWDLAPTGSRGQPLIRALRSKCAPVHAWRKLPVVLGGGDDRLRRADARGVPLDARARARILACSVRASS
jgi:microcystin degradation protein MlrC